MAAIAKRLLLAKATTTQEHLVRLSDHGAVGLLYAGGTLNEERAIFGGGDADRLFGHDATLPTFYVAGSDGTIVACCDECRHVDAEAAHGGHLLVEVIGVLTESQFLMPRLRDRSAELSSSPCVLLDLSSNR